MDLIRFLNLRYFFNQAYEIFTGAGGSAGEGLSFFERVRLIWELALPYLQTISTYLSLIFLIIFIYSYIRLQQVKVDEKKALAAHYVPTDDEREKNDEWEKIVELTNSENPNDWRQAVLSADVMLDKLVTSQGYRGDGLGEKMKSIDKADFRTLDLAWEAHKVRNRVAHDGGDYVLTQREAKRVIGFFGDVFKEFGLV